MSKKLSDLALLELLDLLEEYEDDLDYDKYYTPFVNVISRDKKALIDNDNEEAEAYKIIRQYIRAIVSTGIKTFDEVKSEVSETKSVEGEVIKAFSYDKYKRWHSKLSQKIPKIERDFHNKLIMPISVSYGKGFERAMTDLGVKPNLNWMYMPGHSVERLTNLVLLQHISTDLQMEMRAAVVDGMRAGENPKKIARRIRKVSDSPKTVNVKPLIDPKTGEVVRKGYSYQIPSKRYSEIVARTEVNRATNHGRLDGYQRSKVVKSVEVLTAGDNRVCDICEPLDRQVFEIEEARAIIPVHCSCRCSWTVHKYDVDEDKEKIQERFEVSDMDRVVNTLPMNRPTDILSTLEDMNRYKKHLVHFGLDNIKGHAKVYSKIKTQLRTLGVESFEGWKYSEFNNIYALHNIKNSRLLLQRNIKVKLPKIKILKYEKVIQGDKNTLGMNSIDLKTKSHTLTFSESGIHEHLYRTSLHEQGHQLYKPVMAQDKSKVMEKWGELYKTTAKKDFITSYASINRFEDFAETLAHTVLYPEKVRIATHRKFIFMQQYVLKKKASNI